MEALALKGGFEDAPRTAANAFRVLMNTMARPGLIEVLEGGTPPAPLSIAAGTLVLTLADPDTPICLAGACDEPAVRKWIAFHTGAPLVGPGQADFVLGAWQDLLPLAAYRVGTPEYPDRSATLVAEVPILEPAGAQLSGPGIQDTAALSIPDPALCAENHARFPLGLDFYFTCGDRIAALPRSTRIG